MIMWKIATPLSLTSHKANTLHDFFDLLERSLNHATRAEVLGRVRAIFTLFLEVFDLPSNSEGASTEVRQGFGELHNSQGPKSTTLKLISSIEKQSIRAFVAFVTKLSESTFTPLFRRLQDWAWTSEDIATGGHALFVANHMVPFIKLLCLENLLRRRNTVCRVMSSLLETFKASLAPC